VVRRLGAAAGALGGALPGSLADVGIDEDVIANVHGRSGRAPRPRAQPRCGRGLCSQGISREPGRIDPQQSLPAERGQAPAEVFAALLGTAEAGESAFPASPCLAAPQVQRTPAALTSVVTAEINTCARSSA
jgi:hypothetical protein